MGKIPAFSTWPRIEASASSTWPRNGIKRMQSNESAKLEIPIFKEDFYFENKDKLAAKNCNSVMNLKSFEILAVGRYISDLIAIIGSIDIVLGEIDR